MHLGVSPAYVHRTALWDRDGRSIWGRGLCSEVLQCGRCSLASMGLIRLGPKPRGAPWEHAGQMHQRGLTWPPSAGGRVASGGGPGPFPVWWPNTKGLRWRGRAQGPRVSSGMSPLAPPGRPGGPLGQSRARTCVCTHISVWRRAACGRPCQAAHFGHHLPRKAQAPVGNSCRRQIGGEEGERPHPGG